MPAVHAVSPPDLTDEAQTNKGEYAIRGESEKTTTDFKDSASRVKALPDCKREQASNSLPGRNTPTRGCDVTHYKRQHT